jgi:protein gp37
MATNSKISWTKHTGNLWWGCVEVHAGCDHCYARAWDKRHGGDHWGAPAVTSRRPIKSVWTDLSKWQKSAEIGQRRDAVFVGSMMDIFERPVGLDDLPDGYGFGPFQEEDDDLADVVSTGSLRKIFMERVVPTCPNLFFLLLTKRPQNILRMIPPVWASKAWPANVMVGCSPVTQETVDRDVAALVEVPGQRFLSVEPLLEAVNLRRFLDRIDWVIVGGESGYGARPLETAWVLDIVDQCKTAGVPVFVKQMGSVWAKANRSADSKGGDMAGWPEPLRVQELPVAALTLSLNQPLLVV